MTGLLRKAALLGACGLITAGTATAGVPDVAQSKLLNAANAEVNNIPVAYVTTGNVAAAGAATEAGGRSGPTARKILVKDFSGNPISGALVKISFSDCCDVVLCTSTGQAGVSNNLSIALNSPNVSGFTNAGGEFSFIVVGAGQNDKANTLTAGYRDGCIPYTGLATVVNPSLKTTKVFANVGAGDVLIKQATSYVYNQDGANLGPLFTANDASRVFNDALTSPGGGGTNPRGRDDFNHNGLVTAGDASFPFQEFLNGSASASGCGTLGPLGVRVNTCP